MRRIILIWVGVMLSWASQARADDPCTAAAAARVLAQSGAKSHSEAVGVLTKSLQGCKNRFEVLREVLSKGRLVTGAKQEPKQGSKQDSGSAGQQQPKQAVAESIGYSPLALEAILTTLRNELSETMRALNTECGGFAKCNPDRLRKFLSDIEWYLHVVREPPKPDRVVREAGTLLASLAESSPEVGLAQAIIATLETLSDADRARLSARHGEIGQALARKDIAEKLRILLESPDRLKIILGDVVAAGPSRVLLAGRSVNVALRLGALQEEASCGPALRAKLEAALQRRKPHGALLYSASAPEFAQRLLTKHAELRASFVNPGGECRAAAGERCLALDMDAWLDSGAFGKSDEPPSLKKRLIQPMKGCEFVNVALNDLVLDAFEQFSVAWNAGDVSLDSAKLIQPGCVELLAERRPLSQWKDASTKQALRRSILLVVPPRAPADWPGFQQEMVTALDQSPNVFAGVSATPAPASPDATRLSWKRETETAAGRIKLELRAPPSAGSVEADLIFTPVASQECASELVLKHTIAQRTAAWLANQYTAAAHETDVVSPSPRQGPREHAKKNWGFALLGFLVAGLPQLADDDPRNDLRGVVFAATDVALLTTTVVLLALSSQKRIDVSDGKSTSVESSNDLLEAGRYTALGLIAPRVLSFAW
jgi:hypothetical protein